MKRITSFIATFGVLLNFFIAPISVLAQVAPSLVSADVTSDGDKIGDLSGATLTINNVSGTHDRN